MKASSDNRSLQSNDHNQTYGLAGWYRDGEGDGSHLHGVGRYWGLGVIDCPIVRSGASFEFWEAWISMK